MNVLIGCECSGAVRDAMLARGHEAWSVDLQPIRGSRAGNHHVGDLRRVLQTGVVEGYHIRSGREGRFWRRWDLLIAHPDCTYLTNSAEWAYSDGPYHMRLKPGTLTGAARRAARREALEFVMLLANCGIPRIAIENPVGALSRLWRKPDQIIQPHQFGDDASKATCLWLQGLPLLRPTKHIPGRTVTLASGRVVERWANQTDSGQNRLPPSADRAHLRAVTYPGIAAAMADQWTF